jgi:hypothetical protein
MEVPKDDLLKMAVERPTTAIMVTAGSIAPYYLALMYYNWRGVVNQGFFMIAGTALMLSFFPMCIMGLAYIVRKDDYSAPEKDEWHHGLASTGLHNALFTYLLLAGAYLWKLEFRMFMMFAYCVPVLTVVWLYIYTKLVIAIKKRRTKIHPTGPHL